MAQLVKHYPDTPHKNRVVFSGKKEDMVFHLNEIEKRLDREKISKCGTVFTETARFGDDCLRVCIYKNVDTDNEETIDITYNVFP